MRLIQCPQVRVPALVDTPWHTAKDRYASGGGQNSFWLIDTDCVLVHRNGGPFRPLNEGNAMEHALRQLLAAGGRGVLPREPDHRAFEPVRPTVVLHGASVTAVDSQHRTLELVKNMDGRQARYTCKIARQTRIEIDGQPADSDQSLRRCQ